MKRLALAFVFALAMLSIDAAQAQKLSARDSATVQDCVKSKDGAAQESCVGVVSGPCLSRKETQSTADMVACIARETAVWDDILNETFRRLREKLDDKQKGKLRDMQRAWIASRDASCGFYWDYHQGTMASPMSAECVNRETGRRVVFLLAFLLDAEGR